MLQIQSLDAQQRKTTLEIDPVSGGVVCSYVTECADGLRHWFAPADETRPACFAMVPFCSRIAHGTFDFAGQTIRLRANNPPEPHAIHGHGLMRSWQVLEHRETEVMMGFEHEPDEWPWRYRATARYALRGMSMRVELALYNLSARIMPVGLGLHPYLPCPSATQLQAGVSGWLQLDDELLPVAVKPLPEALNLTAGITVAEQRLDHVFLGWGGRATVEWPGQPRPGIGPARMLLQSSAPYLVVWAPGGDFFCVEGVSNLPDAFNGRLAGMLESQTGFVRLDPGKVHAVTWSFSPEVID